LLRRLGTASISEIDSESLRFRSLASLEGWAIVRDQETDRENIQGKGGSYNVRVIVSGQEINLYFLIIHVHFDVTVTYCLLPYFALSLTVLGGVTRHCRDVQL